MGERSYLAIGDVLALLREEFPDVTISKIRFLESRGLLVPERTPSGYRKFYEPDVERLRWILRQQREHFLPLKVIKGRLDNGMSDPDAPAPHLFEMGDPPPERESEAVLVGAPGTAEIARESAQTAARGAGADRDGRRLGRWHAEARGRTGPGEPCDRRAGRARVARTGPTGSPSGAARPRPRAANLRRPVDRAGSEGQAGTGIFGRLAAQAANAARGRCRAHADRQRVNFSRRGRERRAQGRCWTSPPAPNRSRAGLPGAGLSGASLTLGELANASGLEVAGIDELESFGLIAGRTVAGVHCYDEEAVLVAKLAAGFAPYGIGARHLRIFKHAADRQAGLFAQVVTPLLRQRNPGARARAIEDLSELSELGEALMRCFSQAALRELTGG